MQNLATAPLREWRLLNGGVNVCHWVIVAVPTHHCVPTILCASDVRGVLRWYVDGECHSTNIACVIVPTLLAP